MPWLDAVLGTVASIAMMLFVAVNAAYLGGVLLTRDRRFVDRWTKPLVVTDAALLVAAVGTPIIGISLQLGGRLLSYLAALPATMMPGK